MLILPKKSKLILPEHRQGGYFIEHVGEHKFFRKNTLVRTGAEWMLKTFFQGAAVTPATYYMGLTSAGYAWDSTLAALAAGEPVGNGYARQALTKNNVDWTVQEVNGVMQVLSKLVTFTCAGANWTQNWQRAFLCDAAAGTVGNLVAVSGPAPAPRVVTPGNGPTEQYTFYIRG